MITAKSALQFVTSDHCASPIKTSTSTSTASAFSIEQIEKNICDWKIVHGVTRNCANDVLKIFKNAGINITQDIRNILNTPKNHQITEIENGTYLNLGILFIIKPHLENIIQLLPYNITLKLSFNIDGIPLAKSSKTQFWPILLSILNVPILSNTIFPVGIFHSFSGKPKDLNQFLKPFLDELKILLINGIIIEDKQINFDLCQIVCDAPAKSFLLNVKNVNGYYGCNSCEVKGKSSDSKMCFLSTNAPLRTNESFRNKTNKEYHKDDADSPIVQLPINITDVVVLDPMHCVFLGVMKRLLEFWTKGRIGDRSMRISEENKIYLNKKLIKLRTVVPTEFARLPRTLDDLPHFKATEYREILLYTGVIVLKGSIKNSHYNHFLLLSVAIRILSSDKCISLNLIAYDLLIKFVNKFALLYGSEYSNYNVHSLIHLPYFVRIHGPLDTFSAFKYENYLQQLNKIYELWPIPAVLRFIIV